VELIPIAESARQHGVSDEDMRHALSNAVLSTDQEDPERLLLIGTDCAGTPWLEVVVLDPDRDPVIIHAMKARPHLLRGLE
jgi:hypothetical protein